MKSLSIYIMSEYLVAIANAIVSVIAISCQIKGKIVYIVTEGKK